MHFHLAVLDDAHDFLRIIRFDAILDLDDLLDLVAADLLDVAFVEEAHIDLAFGQFVGQHVAHLAELEFRVRKRGQFVFLVFDAGVAALEVEAGRDFLVGLLDGILDFDHIGFGDYIK